MVPARFLAVFLVAVFLAQGASAQFDYTRPPPGEPICPGMPKSFDLGPGNIIENPGFGTAENGSLPASWGSYESVSAPANGQCSANFNRSNNAAGPEWDVSGRMNQVGALYKLAAWVKIFGPSPDAVREVSIDLFLGSCDVCKGGRVNSGTPPLFRNAVGGPFHIAKGVASQACWTLLTGEHILSADTLIKTIRYSGAPTDSALFVRSIQLVPTSVQDYRNQQDGQIDAVRRSGLNIRVVDGNNNPIANAEVSVDQVGHLFKWGGGYDASFYGNPTLTDAWRRMDFSYGAPYNELKWYSMEPNPGQLNYGPADAVMSFARDQNIKLRVNNVFWEQYNPPDSIYQNPYWVVQGGLSQDQMRAAIAKRITDLIPWAVKNYPGIVADWDVDNEDWHSNFFGNYLGDESIHEYMYKEVARYDPNAGLSPNDYNFFERIDEVPSNRQQEATGNIEQWLNDIFALKNSGIRIDSIGLQGQYGLAVENGYGNLPQPGYMRRIFDRIQYAGLKIWITELNIRIPDDFERAQHLETILRECFAHPAVVGVIYWGWSPNGGACNTCWLDNSFNLNAAGARYLDLRARWTTHEKRTTDGNGFTYARAFHGRHAVTVSANGQTSQAFVDVGPGGDAFVEVKVGGRRRKMV